MSAAAREKSIEVTAEDAAAVVAASTTTTTTTTATASMLSSPASPSSSSVTSSAPTPRNSSTTTTTTPTTTTGIINTRSTSSSVKKQLTKLMGKTLSSVSVTMGRPLPKLTNHNHSHHNHNRSTSTSSSSSPILLSNSQSKTSQQRRRRQKSNFNNTNAEIDNNSYNSESIGQMSVGTPTVASLDTVKISNRQQQQQQQFSPNNSQQQQRQEHGGGGGDTTTTANNDSNSSGSNKKTPWKKLKQFMGLPPNNSNSSNNNDMIGGGKTIRSAAAARAVDTTNNTEDQLLSVSDAIVATNGTIPTITTARHHHHRTHSKSVDYLDINNNNFNNNPTTTSAEGRNNNNNNNNNNKSSSARRRISSMDFPTKFISNNNNKRLQQKQQQQQQEHQNNLLHQQQTMLDDAVRGRLDGMDLLYLGPAHMISLERRQGQQQQQQQQQKTPRSANNDSGSNRSLLNHDDNDDNDDNDANDQDYYYQSSSSSSSSSTPWEPSPTYSFAGRSTQYTTKQMVTDMIHRSMGQDSKPEIILEGFFRDDRWIINLDNLPPNNNNNNNNNYGMEEEDKEEAVGGGGKQKQQNSSSIGGGGASCNILLAAAGCDDDDESNNNNNSNGRQSPHDGLPPLQLTDEEDHSHSSGTAAAAAAAATAADYDMIIPRHKLWGYMWGSEKKIPPKPSHMTSLEDVDPDSDSLLEMAASCSVPIDVDEDTFMISNAQHLQAVHELASVPIQHLQFDEAMDIFQRILRGVQGQAAEEENNHHHGGSGASPPPPLRHLEGVTLHNMSVICMWQEDYEGALDFAGKAVKARLQYLPENHPDIAVSLVRQGYAYFALERFDMAEASFEGALEKLPPKDNVIKAKVLLNLGVARYQRGDDVAALKNFTDALEIQRLWLQGPVKREATVFGAAVMLGNIGKIHIKRGDYDLAVSVYEESLLLLTSIFRADHDLVLANLISLSLAWAFNSLPVKAGQILNGVLRSQLSRMGPATIPVVETTGAIGNLHFGLGNYEDALKCFAPVLKWQKANLDSEHPALRRTKDIMKRIKKSIQAVWV